MKNLTQAAALKAARAYYLEGEETEKVSLCPAKAKDGQTQSAAVHTTRTIYRVDFTPKTGSVVFERDPERPETYELADEMKARRESEAKAAQDDSKAVIEVVTGEIVPKYIRRNVAPSTLNMIDETITRVADTMRKIEQGYLSVVGDVKRLYDLKAWTVTGHKNIYELCADKFGMSRGTVSNLRQIGERFVGDDYELIEEASGLGVRAMLEQIAQEKKKALPDKEGEKTDAQGEPFIEEPKASHTGYGLRFVSTPLEDISIEEDGELEAFLSSLADQIRSSGETKIGAGTLITISF